MFKLCVIAESAGADKMQIKNGGVVCVCVAENQEMRETALKTNTVTHPELQLKVPNSHWMLSEVLKVAYGRSQPVTICLFPVFLVLLRRHTHCCP